MARDETRGATKAGALLASAALVCLVWLARAAPLRPARRLRPRVLVVTAGPMKLDPFYDLLDDPSCKRLRRLFDEGSAVHFNGATNDGEALLAGAIRGRGTPPRGWMGWQETLAKGGWTVRREGVDLAKLRPDDLRRALERTDGAVLEVRCPPSADARAVLEGLDRGLAGLGARERRGTAVAILFHGRHGTAPHVAVGLFWGEPFRRRSSTVVLDAGQLGAILHYVTGQREILPTQGHLPWAILAPGFLLHNEL